jgi:hypothetical protein
MGKSSSSFSGGVVYYTGQYIIMHQRYIIPKVYYTKLHGKQTKNTNWYNIRNDGATIDINISIQKNIE